MAFPLALRALACNVAMLVLITEAQDLDGALSTCSVERVAYSAEFPDTFEQVYRDQKAVIVTGAMTAWAALGPKWNEKSFIESFGNLRGKVVDQQFDEAAGLSKDSLPDYTTLGQFLDPNREARLKNKICLDFEGDLYPSIYPDIQPNIDFLETLTDGTVFSLGRKGTGSGIHRHDQNWLAQVKGRKAWILADADTEEGQWTKIEPCPLLENLDQFKELQACSVKAGELLYIPPKTWHGTCNLEDFNIGVGGRGDSSDKAVVLQAARICDLEGVKKAVEAPESEELEAQAEGLHGAGQRPLHVAAKMNCLSTVEYLLEKEAEVQAKDKDPGYTPLHLAAVHGHLEIVDALVQKQAQVDTTDNLGITALHSASAGGHAPVVKFLMEQGSDIQALTADEAKPIHMAASVGHKSVVELLIALGAEVHGDQKGSVPIQQAALGGHVGVVAALVEKKADIHAKTGQGFNLVHVASTMVNTDVLEYLVEKQGLSASAEPPAIAPTHIAAQSGHGAALEYLLEHGGKATAEGPGGWRPIHIAAQSGHAAAVAVLLEAKANPTQKTEDGATAIALATQAKASHVVKMLTEKAGPVKRPAYKGPVPHQGKDEF